MVNAAAPRRGVFVVFEGVDRAGKSTQCRLLAEGLRKLGRPCEQRNFPDRTTEVGGMIDRYLRKEIEMDDRAVHLLFSANRWDAAADIRAKLAAGTDVVCDRYAYSGVAFTAAKPSIDDLAWCKAPDAGLPKPDVVVFLEIPSDKAEARAGFGGERYETSDMQKRVAGHFGTLRAEDPGTWAVLDAARDIETVRQDVERVALAAAAKCAEAPVGQLWD